MSDVNTVKKMLDLTDHYGLSGADFVHSFPIEQLAEDFNGIGPEWFPPKLREAIDNLSEILLPMAFVHDVRWSHSDGTEYYFTRSNEELKKNGYTIAKAECGWYNPRRYLLMNKARVFGNLCQHFGYSAYLTAYNKQKGN